MKAETYGKFAKRNKVSRPYISKLVAQGKLPRTKDGRIPSEAGDQAFKDNRGGTMRGPQNGNGSNGNAIYNQQRGISEHYRAKLLQLRHERESGRLVSREEVLQAITQASSNVRTRLRSIPRALAAILAGTQNALEVEKILSDAIDGALEELASDVFAKGKR